MATTQPDTRTLPEQLYELRRAAERERLDLLAKRAAASAEMPLRFWNQQAQFTTPASGTPEKAIRGLKAVPALFDRFGISPETLAEHSGASLPILKELIDGDDKHSPFVMVDVEDAVALTPESIARARDGAVRCFTQEAWGSTLPFFRPAGLRLDTCVEDLTYVFGEVAERAERAEFPIAGIVWPKAEHADEIRWVCDLLARMEERIGLPANSVRLEFLVESGYALAQLPELTKAAIGRLTGIIWGIADYSADTNLPAIKNTHPVCDWARYEIVNIAGAANVPAIDAMTLNYPTPLHRDKDLTDKQKDENRDKILGALKEVYDDARHGIALGMSGKWVGHPLQLLMVLAAFRETLPMKQIEKDIREIESYTASVQAGAGATVMGEGADAYMADRATDRHLRARLRRATAWRRIDPARAHSLGVIDEAELRELQG
jgi:citrate lyase beta subunit